MLIQLKPFLEQSRIEIKTCIHVGGHYAEEYEAYKECGIEEMVFIEPCMDAYLEMSRRMEGKEGVTCIKCAAGSEEKEMQINVEHDNQGQSNSLLEPKLHLQQHENVRFLGETELVYVRKLDEILTTGIFKGKDFKKPIMLSMDTQGYEGEVLKGATSILNSIDVIYSEINTGETYKGNMLVDEMDEFLKVYGFARVETYMPSPNWTWGDAIWLKVNHFIGEPS